MKKILSACSLVVALSLGAGLLPGAAHAQSEASLAVSALPVASVVLSAAAAGTAASAVVAVPAALSVAGRQLVIKGVEGAGDVVVFLPTEKVVMTGATYARGNGFDVGPNRSASQSRSTARSCAGSTTPWCRASAR